MGHRRGNIAPAPLQKPTEGCGRQLDTAQLADGFCQLSDQQVPLPGLLPFVRTELGYRRFRCRDCACGFNERSGTLFNRLQYPTDVVCLVVLWRLRYKLSLRDLVEMFALRGFIFTHEAVRECEARLAPHVTEELRKARRGRIGRSWYADEAYIRVPGRWCYLYRAIDHRILTFATEYTNSPPVTPSVAHRFGG